MVGGGWRMEDGGLRGSSRRWVVRGRWRLGVGTFRRFSVLDRVGVVPVKRPRWRGGDAGSTSWDGPRPFVAHAIGHSADRASVAGRPYGWPPGKSDSVEGAGLCDGASSRSIGLLSHFRRSVSTRRGSRQTGTRSFCGMRARCGQLHGLQTVRAASPMVDGAAGSKRERRRLPSSVYPVRTGSRHRLRDGRPGSAKRPRWRRGDVGSTSRGGPRPFVAHAIGHSADRAGDRGSDQRLTTSNPQRPTHNA